MLAFRILRAAGLDPSRDIRAQSLGVAQSVDALKDGKIDAFFWNGGLPTAGVVDLVNTPGIDAHFISTTDWLPALQQTYGGTLYYRALIPKGTYDNDVEIPVVAVANLLVVSDAMPEALAYDITRTLFDHQVELAAIHPQARELSLATALTGSPIPYHAGAHAGSIASGTCGRSSGQSDTPDGDPGLRRLPRMRSIGSSASSIRRSIASASCCWRSSSPGSPIRAAGRWMARSSR